MTRKHQPKTCYGLGCGSTELIDAHIIPAGFARLVRDADGSGPNIKMTLTSSGTAKQQLGEYDASILCERCDNKLGKYEDYAMETLASFGQRHSMAEEEVAEMPEIRRDLLALSTLAVVWKASISLRPAFDKISLGLYENRARDVLFGATPLSMFRDFKAIFVRFQSETTNVEALLCSLSRARFASGHAYFFAVAGFRVIAVFDPRPLPAWARQFVVNDSSVLRAPIVDLEQTSEFKKMFEMTQAKRRRSSKE